MPPLVRSLSSDHFVADEGNIVYYEKDPAFWYVFAIAACAEASSQGFKTLLPSLLVMTHGLAGPQVHSSAEDLWQEGDSASQLVKTVAPRSSRQT